LYVCNKNKCIVNLYQNCKSWVRGFEPRMGPYQRRTCICLWPYSVFTEKKKKKTGKKKNNYNKRIDIGFNNVCVLFPLNTIIIILYMHPCLHGFILVSEIFLSRT
jgi:hypothetical protein